MPSSRPSASPPRTEPSSSSGAKESPVHLGLRVAAMLIGLPILTIAIAAWLAMMIESPWIALGVAAAITILPTLLLADRLLPADDPRKGGGIATDALSVVWLGGAALVLGPLGFLLHDPLVDYAERTAGPGFVVTIADFVTGTPDEAPDVASAETTTEAGVEDAGPAADDAGSQAAGTSTGVE